MSRCRLAVVVALVLGLAGPVLAADEGPVRYDNYRSVRVHVSDPAQIEAIHAAGGILLSCHEGVGIVDYLFAPEEMDDFVALGLPWRLLHDNIQKLIDAERALLEAQPEVDGRDPAWFTNYKTLDQVNAKLNQMAADRPDLATVFSVGNTLENRTIYGIRITGPGTNKPAILFNGCHHAREWISVMVPMWIADRLVYEYDTNPQLQALVDDLEIFIVPVVNLDGYVYSWSNERLWRKNRRLNAGGCRGVDDNRNYATGWGGGGSSGDPCSDLYRGTVAFSEPETAAMRDFYIAHPQLVTVMSYHSYSQLIMSPYGYTSTLPPAADHAIFMELNEGMSDAVFDVHGMQYSYGPIYSTIYQASGGDTDWIYADQDIFAFTTELRDTGSYGFELPANQIVPTCEENFAAALYLAEWTATPVKISFPSGWPTRLTPNEAQPVTVRIYTVGAELDPNSLRLHTRVGGSQYFTEHTLTPLGDNQYEALLPATPCGLTLHYYVSAATTTGITGVSPADAPAATYDVTAEPILLVLEKNMDVNPLWTKLPNTAANQWAWGDPTGGGGEYGGPDPQTGFTGNNVIGYNLSGDYANNLSEMHITSLPINCTGMTGVKLTFQRWLGVEQSQYDHAYVRVSNNGTAYTTVWQNSNTLYDGAWVTQEIDISALADNKQTVYLRWTMGTTDGGWRYCGWNIDDVQVWANDPNGCPPMTGDLDCDGTVGFGDINPFVLALSNPAAYAASFPDCDPLNGDIDGSGALDFGDINPFVALLSSW